MAHSYDIAGDQLDTDIPFCTCEKCQYQDEQEADTQLAYAALINERELEIIAQNELDSAQKANF